MSGVLKVESISKSWGGVAAVSDVSFELQRGEMLAVIGPNGAGKSTCFNLINGHLQCDFGKVVFDGMDVTSLRPRRKWALGIGRTFQISRVFSSMTVRQCVQTAITASRSRTKSLFNVLPDDYRDESQALLQMVGLGDQADRSCSVLAYGDVKRVELAITLAGKPKMLLMDEPMAGMAFKERMALMDLVANLNRTQDVSILFTEHDMDIVFRHAHRILVLSRGKVIAVGAPQEIRANKMVRDIYLGSSMQEAERSDAARS